MSILETLIREIRDWKDDSRFDWLYLANPFEPARSWLLENEAGEVVGVSSAFPRRLDWNGRELSAWVLGDFCVSAEHRSLGPALRLQRAVNDAVRRGEADVWFDFPSRSMLAVHRRAGLQREGEIVRLAYPLRVDRVLQEKMGGSTLASGMTKAGNAVLAARAWLDTARSAPKATPFEEAFAAREYPAAPGPGVTLSRSRDYLNWRYREDPRGATPVLRTGDTYLAYRRTEDEVAIVDMFGECEDSSLKELVHAVIEMARGNDASSVSVSLSSEHPWVRLMERLGFHRRESAPYAVFASSDAIDEAAPWYLMAADRDQ